MESSFLTLLQQALIGKKIKHKNNHRREIILEVENVTVFNGSRQISPDTQENDWYGESVSYSNYYINFVDGSKIQVTFETKFEIIN